MASSNNELHEHIYSIGSSIPVKCYEIIAGIFFGIAIIATIARSAMRFWTRKPLYWDDLVLVIGTLSYISATILFYMNTYYTYLSFALQQQPILFFQISNDDISYFLNKSISQFAAGTATTWTTIFCVKASFLIISKQLLKRLPWLWLNVYFWFVVGFTFVSWTIAISNPFWECPYTGYDAIKCNTPSRNGLQVATHAVVTSTDVVSDAMIASIPIIILWRSQIDTKQKLLIGPFLCLSPLMIIFSIIRIIKEVNITNSDLAWMSFWQYLEAGMAIIVTSITTIRTVFTTRKQQRKSKLSPSDHLLVDAGNDSEGIPHQDVNAFRSSDENYVHMITKPGHPDGCTDLLLTAFPALSVTNYEIYAHLENNQKQPNKSLPQPHASLVHSVAIQKYSSKQDIETNQHQNLHEALFKQNVML